MVIKENLEQVRELVKKYDRDIVLIAASKTQTSETIDEFMKLAPEFILGENRVQELVAKYNPDYHWHVIGQLQTNKVKYIIDKAELIHSLDRVELAKEIQKQAVKHNKIQPCLVEINMGAEITKGGVQKDQVIDFIKSMVDFPNIKVMGLMAVMPNLGDTPELHNLYDELYAIFEEAKKIKQDNVEIKYLSCGMSNDYKIALEHGSNMIRLGRCLFGERYYPPKQD